MTGGFRIRDLGAMAIILKTRGGVEIGSGHLPARSLAEEEEGEEEEEVVFLFLLLLLLLRWVVGGAMEKTHSVCLLLSSSFLVL